MKLSPRYEGRAIIEFDGPADDQREPVTRQRRRMEQLLARLDDDSWRSPSRCEGWTVQDVVAHLVPVNSFWQASVAAGVAGEPTRYLATFDPVAHPAQMVDGMRALSPQEVLDQFVASNDAFLGALAALDERGWSARAESPPGHVSVRLLAHHALWDAWIHERDIALPLGITPPREPDEVYATLRYAAALSPALGLNGAGAYTGALAVSATDPQAQFVVDVGESVVVRAGAPESGVPCLRGPATELIEALSIRVPLPEAAPPEWHAVLGGLESAFDAPGAR